MTSFEEQDHNLEQATCEIGGMNINDELYVVMLLKQKHNRPVFFR
jgi:hypothetical protein